MNNETKYNMAVKLMQEERWTEAIQLFVDVLADHPDFENGYAWYDLAYQKLVEKKSWSDVSWPSVGISAGAGALGVGLGNMATKLVGQTALKGGSALLARAAINGAGSSMIGGGTQVANNAVDGTNLSDGVGSAMAWSGGVGSLGSVVGDLASIVPQNLSLEYKLKCIGYLGKDPYTKILPNSSLRVLYGTGRTMSQFIPNIPNISNNYAKDK